MNRSGYSLEPMMSTHRNPVIDIFNYHIKNGFEAYRELPVGYDYFDYLMEKLRKYPALVAKTNSGDVVGFGYLRPYSLHDAFKKTAQITYFILPEHRRKGLGRAILEELIRQAQDLGVDNLLAHISSLNEGSLEFHLKNGFQECGRFMGIGKKFGKNFDVICVQRRL
jgi:phosphinothricin acetyltransferase